MKYDPTLRTLSAPRDDAALAAMFQRRREYVAHLRQKTIAVGAGRLTPTGPWIVETHLLGYRAGLCHLEMVNLTRAVIVQLQMQEDLHRIKPATEPRESFENTAADDARRREWIADELVEINRKLNDVARFEECFGVNAPEIAADFDAPEYL